MKKVKMNALEKIRKVIKKLSQNNIDLRTGYSGKEPNKSLDRLLLKMNIKDEIILNSVEFLVIIIGIEEEFEVEIDDNYFEIIETLEDLVIMVELLVINKRGQINNSNPKRGELE